MLLLLLLLLLPPPAAPYQFTQRRSMLATRSPLWSSQHRDDYDEEFVGRQPPTMRLVGECLERRAYVYEARLCSPLGIKLQDEPAGEKGSSASAVVVCSVDPSGTAWSAGVRRGDRIVATGASWGGGIHLTSTVDGVTAAVASRVRMFGDVVLRFERPFDGPEEVSWRSIVSETFVVEVAKPLGMVLEERGAGADRAVYVKALDPAGNAASSGQVKKGDRLLKVSASLGDAMWEARSVDGVVSAVSTRLATGQRVRFELERKVGVGTWSGSGGGADGDGRSSYANGEYADGEDGADGDNDDEPTKIAAKDGLPGPSAAPKLDGIEDTLEALEALQSLDVSSSSTKAVLLERCTALVLREAKSTTSDAAAKVGQIAAVVLKAKVMPSAKFVNIVMTTFLRMKRANEAVRFYDSFASAGFTPNMQVATTLAAALTPPANRAVRAAKIAQKSKRSVLKAKPPPPRQAASERGAASPMRSPMSRLAAAVATLERERIQPDTFFLNQLMRCYIFNGHLAEAEGVFYRLMKAGGASAAEEKTRPCAPDQISWNIMIDGYARQGLADQAKACFQDMAAARTPDLFTYTALLKALVGAESFDLAEEVLATLETSDGVSSPRPDRFMYNQLLGGYARSLRWREALETVERMTTVGGYTPNEDTYAVLVPCLVRSRHADLAVRCLDEMRSLQLRISPKM